MHWPWVLQTLLQYFCQELSITGEEHVFQRPTSLARDWGRPSVLLIQGRTTLANDQSHRHRCNLLRTKSLPQAGTDTSLGMERGRQNLHKANQKYFLSVCSIPESKDTVYYTFLPRSGLFYWLYNITIFLILCKGQEGWYCPSKQVIPPEHKQKKVSKILTIHRQVYSIYFQSLLQI